MAIKLGAMDTQIVLTALYDYKETLDNIPGDRPMPHVDARIADVKRLIKSFNKSFATLDRLGIK